MNCYYFDTSYITTTLIYGSDLLQLGINFCFNCKLQYIIQKVSKMHAVSYFKCACMGKPIDTRFALVGLMWHSFLKYGLIP